jgi:hypothetical protein
MKGLPWDLGWAVSTKARCDGWPGQGAVLWDRHYANGALRNGGQSVRWSGSDARQDAEHGCHGRGRVTASRQSRCPERHEVIHAVTCGATKIDARDLSGQGVAHPGQNMPRLAVRGCPNGIRGRGAVLRALAADYGTVSSPVSPAVAARDPLRIAAHPRSPHRHGAIHPKQDHSTTHALTAVRPRLCHRRR